METLRPETSSFGDPRWWGFWIGNSPISILSIGVLQGSLAHGMGVSLGQGRSLGAGFGFLLSRGIIDIEHFGQVLVRAAIHVQYQISLSVILSTHETDAATACSGYKIKGQVQVYSRKK
jgi:hypothetical protein